MEKPDWKMGLGFRTPRGERAGAGPCNKALFPFVVVGLVNCRCPSKVNLVKEPKPSHGALRGTLDRVCSGPTDSRSHLLWTWSHLCLSGLHGGLPSLDSFTFHPCPLFRTRGILLSLARADSPRHPGAGMGADQTEGRCRCYILGGVVWVYPSRAIVCMWLKKGDVPKFFRGTR